MKINKNATVAVHGGGGSLPHCMLGYTSQVWAWRPPGYGPGKTPLRCGPGDPPGFVSLENPPGVGLETPLARPLDLPLGVGLETALETCQVCWDTTCKVCWDTTPCCKACWDTTYNACWDTTTPPPVNRILDTCYWKILPCPKLRLRAVIKLMTDCLKGISYQWVKENFRRNWD